MPPASEEYRRLGRRNESGADEAECHRYDATFFHQDVLGSTILIVDRRGWETEAFRYDVYGQQYDDRLTLDPIREGSNWRLFVDADPVNRTDPNGLDIFAIGGFTSGDVGGVGKAEVDLVVGFNGGTLQVGMYQSGGGGGRGNDPLQWSLGNRDLEC